MELCRDSVCCSPASAYPDKATENHNRKRRKENERF
nr:MAG TPA: hypothetical protein [Caudoviricetes sp.]